jgi:hypothetical protein
LREHQTFAPNIDEDEAKVLLLTSCYQEVAWFNGRLQPLGTYMVP